MPHFLKRKYQLLSGGEERRPGALNVSQITDILKLLSKSVCKAPDGLIVRTLRSFFPVAEK